MKEIAGVPKALELLPGGVCPTNVMPGVATLSPPGIGPKKLMPGVVTLAPPAGIPTKWIGGVATFIEAAFALTPTKEMRGVVMTFVIVGAGTVFFSGAAVIGAGFCARPEAATMKIAAAAARARGNATNYRPGIRSRSEAETLPR